MSAFDDLRQGAAALEEACKEIQDELLRLDNENDRLRKELRDARDDSACYGKLVKALEERDEARHRLNTKNDEYHSVLGERDQYLSELRRLQEKYDELDFRMKGLEK